MDDNIRVIESRRSSGFLDKPLLAVCAGWSAGRQNLYCDKAVQAYVTGLINLSHSAYCDGSQDLVGAELVTYGKTVDFERFTAGARSIPSKWRNRPCESA